LLNESKNVLKVKRDLLSVFLRIGKLAVSFHNLKNTFAPGNYESSCQKIPRLLDKRCSFLQTTNRWE